MPTVEISKRAAQTPASPIRRLNFLATRAKECGTKVYHLNIGQPDLPSPPQFLSAVRGFNESTLAYENSKGNEKLCASWSKFMKNTLDLEISSESLVITTGASEALIFAFMTCCDPGDEIVLFDPTYANFMGFAAIAGVKLSAVATDFDSNFAMPPIAKIQAAINRKTKAILVCNPNNPTGTVYTRDDLSALASLADEHNLFLIVDETYREFVYDGIKPVSILHLTRSDRVIVIDSLSKRFSLCGARIGCLISGNSEVLAAVQKIAQARLAAPTIEQIAATSMFETMTTKYMTDVGEVYRNRRDALCSKLEGIGQVSFTKPAGAFYLLVELPVTDTDDFARFLLRDFVYRGATAFVAPAGGFYIASGRGLNQIRVAFVLEAAALEFAVEIIEHGLAAYGRRNR